MSTFLILIVLVLVAIAVWQMAKIFDLSQVKTDKGEVASDKDNKYNGYLMLAFMIFTYAITIFSFWKYWKVLLPEASSAHGAEYDLLMGISFIIIFIVQFITQALLHYFAFKYRGKEGQRALYFADNENVYFPQ